MARIEHPGCGVCITLGCGNQLRGPNVRFLLRPHCLWHSTAIRLDFQLPNPISTFFKPLPPLDELTKLLSKSEAKIQNFQQIQPECKQMETGQTNSKSIERMAEPILERIRVFHGKCLFFGFFSFSISVILPLTYFRLFTQTDKNSQMFPFPNNTRKTTDKNKTNTICCNKWQWIPTRTSRTSPAGMLTSTITRNQDRVRKLKRRKHKQTSHSLHIHKKLLPDTET